MKAFYDTNSLYKYYPELFDDIAIPDRLDRETLIDTILEMTIELEVLYSRPETFRHIIKVWSQHRLAIWNKMIDTTELEYNPIDNYNRYEEWDDNGDNQGKINSIGKVTGYNSESLVTKDGSNVNNDNEYKDHHKGHIWGNIGVTTSQQMIESERKVVDYDMYSIIAEEFKTKFCLLVY